MSRRLARTLPFVALVLSGAAGLTYEVVWSRAMATLFGSVVTATGMLLAIFMGGLGLGAAWGARWAERTRRPLAAFALVELVVAVLALATPFLLRAAAPLVGRLDAGLPDAVAPLVPAALSVLVLGPVVVLLGTTFPLFLAWANEGAEDGDGLSAVSGRVYGLNTLGAVLGTLLAGFLLLPALGIMRCLVVAAAADLVVGVACLWLARREGDREPRPHEESRGRLEPVEKRAIAMAGLAGFAALALEVAWFRVLMLIFGSSVYALTLMLAAFLVGMAGGALRLAPRGDRDEDTFALVGRYHALVALSATLVTFLLQVLPGLYIPLLTASGGSFGIVTTGSMLILVAILLVPTTLMGAALPMTIRATDAESRRAAEGSAGRVYAASSVGSALGALLAGFLLVPVLGLRGAVFVAILFSLAAAALALRPRPAARRQGLQIAAVTGLVWVVWGLGVLPWDWRVLTGGYYAYAHLYSEDRSAAEGAIARELVLPDPHPFPGAGAQPKVRPAPTGQEEPALLSWEEGQFAQVAVVEAEGLRSLLINGKADASNGEGDMRTQLLLGHLPALLAPSEPEGAAMVVGLGSGVTAGAVGSWPFEELSIAEIEPAVVRASDWFAEENANILEDERVTLRTDDARRVLARSEQPLRLMTSEPSNLWMSGVSLLFTREFFEIAAERLGEDGVFCQWLHLYQVGEEDVRTLLASLIEPFPHVVVFADGTDLLVVGSRSPLTLDPAVWQRRVAANPAAGRALAEAGIRSAADIAEGFVADERAVAAWAEGARLHTDDHPILEFSAARRMASDRSLPILSELVRRGVAAGPIELGAAGAVAGPRP